MRTCTYCGSDGHYKKKKDSKNGLLVSKNNETDKEECVCYECFKIFVSKVKADLRYKKLLKKKKLIGASREQSINGISNQLKS